eukprot:1601631-Prymnesium_polylepis.1
MAAAAATRGAALACGSSFVFVVSSIAAGAGASAPAPLSYIVYRNTTGTQDGRCPIRTNRH